MQLSGISSSRSPACSSSANCAHFSQLLGLFWRLNFRAMLSAVELSRHEQTCFGKRVHCNNWNEYASSKSSKSARRRFVGQMQIKQFVNARKTFQIKPLAWTFFVVNSLKLFPRASLIYSFNIISLHSTRFSTKLIRFTRCSVTCTTKKERIFSKVCIIKRATMSEWIEKCRIMMIMSSRELREPSNWALP